MTTYSLPEEAVLFVVNTDFASFVKTPRAPGESPFFNHWLPAGRLFVNHTLKGDEHGPQLSKMTGGQIVFAYENKVGIVAIGRVVEPYDTARGVTGGGTALYPNPAEVVQSLAVAWDPDVNLDYKIMSQQNMRLLSTLKAYAPGTTTHQVLADLALGQADSWADKRAQRRVDNDPLLTAKDRAQIGQARNGQGIFKRRVFERSGVCRMTGTSNAAYVVASHIKPWAACEGREHIDGDNGLALAPHADRLFDAGLISFTDDGCVLHSRDLDPAALRAYGLHAVSHVAPFSPQQAHYLAYHRQHVFERRKAPRATRTSVI